MSHLYIYLTENLINGRVYIGKHEGEPSDDYLGSGKILKKAICKYGRENFRKTVLEFGNANNIDELERKWIYHYKQTTKIYNLTDGGTGGNTLKQLCPTVVSATRSGWSGKMSPVNLLKLREQRSESMKQIRADPVLESRRRYTLLNTINSKNEEDKKLEYLTRSGINNHNQKSVITPKGKFDTLTAASNEFGVSVSTITNRCNNPNFEDWKWIE